MKKVVRLTESDLTRIVKRVLMENEQQETLTLQNINEQYKKLIHSEVKYRGYIGGDKLKGTIVLTSEFSEMSKRNNWNYPERIDTDFTLAKKLEITQDILDSAKSGGITVNHTIKSDYSAISFIYVNQDASLFKDCPTAKIKPQSILIKCKQGTDILFIFQSLDGNWYYINTVG